MLRKLSSDTIAIKDGVVTKFIFARGKDENGNGSSSTIYFNPYMDKISTLNVDPSTTLVRSESIPNNIVLAHELIHAERAMRGGVLQDLKNISYSYKVGRQQFLGFLWWTYTYSTQSDMSRDELATVGLKYTRKGDITENMIRDEQGINFRGAY